MKKLIFCFVAAAIAACSPPAEKAKEASPGARTGESAAGAGVARAGVASTELVLTKAPAAGARVSSPLSVEGTAPNTWYSQGQFVAQLVNADGVVIAQSPALPQSDWQKAGAVPFIADLVFEVDADTPATLLLQEDNAAGAAPRETRIPVLLAGR